MRYLAIFSLFLLLASCWPKSISFVDGSMPDEWKVFSLKTLENNAPNAPLSYGPRLSEDIKDAIQNNTKLILSNSADAAQVQIEGVISNYSVNPIAIQGNDQAAKNRLSITTNYTIYIKAPKEDEIKLSSTRFADFDSNLDFATVEANLISEINKQITQDIINKLLSNW